MAPSSVLFGATGLVGNHLLTALLSLDAFGTVHTVGRRAPKQASAADASSKKLDAIVETDNDQWASKLQSLASAPENPPTIAFSSVGTTRAAAGGIANQWKIDHDLNVDLVKTAKTAGIKTFMFVSSAGTRGFPSRFAPYSKMKNGVEDTIKEQAFDQTIIVHPGLILGDREVAHQGGPLFTSIANLIGKVSPGLKDTLAQEAEVIARAAAHATLLADQGKAPSKYWVLEPADIVRLGRDEWKF